MQKMGMDKEIVKRFLGKYVKLEKKTFMPNRNTWKLFGTIRAVTDTTVIIYTDREGALLLEDIVSIEEAEDRRR